MATKKRSRRKVKHPGVTLLKPEPARGIGWRARVVEVDTCVMKDGEIALSSGKYKKVALPSDLTTAEQREAWAVDKAKELAKRIAELQAGRPRATGQSFEDVIKRYYADHPKLRGKTKLAYEGATDKLVTWANEHKVTPDTLNRAELMKWRATVLKETKKVRAPGVKRGETVVTEEPRSNYSINRDLRGVRTVLGYLIDADQFPKLLHDDLRRALKRLKVVRERNEYLKPPEMNQLLQAALDHDAATYKMTRGEKDRGERGTTPRYEPIAPFVVAALLGGFRLNEMVTLEHRDLDLDALDHEGTLVGEIHLRGDVNKTYQPRDVILDVSPLLRELFQVLHDGTEAKHASVLGITTGEAEAAMKRLKNTKYKAPKQFTWQALRGNCETYLVCAPGIYGASSVYRAAKQIGHDVKVAQEHYLGLIKGIPVTSKTLEAAMGVEEKVAKVIELARARRGTAQVPAA